MSTPRSPRAASKHGGNQAKQKKAMPSQRSIFARSTVNSVQSHKSSKFAKSSGRVARSVLTTTQPGPTTRGLQIINEFGEDVTPVPLNDKTGSLRVTHSVLFGFGEESEEGSEWSPRASAFTQAGTERRGTIGTLGTGLGRRSTMLSGFSQTWIAGEKEIELPAGLATTHSAYRSIFDEDDDLVAVNLDKPVICTFTETETINLFDLPSTCVPEDDHRVPGIQARNEAYEKLCKSRVGNSRYTERAMQTINEPLKTKGTQESRASNAEQCDFAAVWDMFDDYLKLEPKEDDESEEDLLGDGSGGGGTVMRPGSVQASLASPRSRIASLAAPEEEEGEPAAQMALESLPDGQEKMFIMEKALSMNTYQPRMAQYRRMRPPRPSSAPLQSEESLVTVAPYMLQLWSYRCDETSGRRVTCVRWNRANPDLLAVTYATLAIGEHAGMVCCWSLKNPDHPALVYRPPSGATCCDFSRQNPSLLAVGCYDGSLALYSTAQKSPQPVADSFQSTDKHMGTVWEVQFVLKDEGAGESQREVLMSISEDGHVLQWSTRQGLQNVPVFTMRRDPSFSTKKDNRTRKTDAFISRYAVGMHFSFHPHNVAQFLIGTEGGTAHLCSTSHADQYLFTYSGHMAPVYRVQWSPFCPHVLLTCSADWSFRVWHVEHKEAVLVLCSASKLAILDIAWSPSCATQLAFCTEQEVELWDLAVSALDPLIVHPNVGRGVTNTTLTFGPDGDCLLLGDSAGGVSVYQLESVPEPADDHDQQLEQVVRTQLSRLLSTQADEQEESGEQPAE